MSQYTLEFVGYDDWSRALYKYGDTVLVDVDGILHTMTDLGEPCDPTSVKTPEGNKYHVLLAVRITGVPARSEEEAINLAKNRLIKSIKHYSVSEGMTKLSPIVVTMESEVSGKPYITRLDPGDFDSGDPQDIKTTPYLQSEDDWNLDIQQGHL